MRTPKLIIKGAGRNPVTMRNRLYKNGLEDLQWLPEIVHRGADYA